MLDAGHEFTLGNTETGTVTLSEMNEFVGEHEAAMRALGQQDGRKRNYGKAIVQGSSTPIPLNAYELEREANMKRIAEKLDELGLKRLKANLKPKPLNRALIAQVSTTPQEVVAEASRVMERPRVPEGRMSEDFIHLHR